MTFQINLCVRIYPNNAHDHQHMTINLSTRRSGGAPADGEEERPEAWPHAPQKCHISVAHQARCATESHISVAHVARCATEIHISMAHQARCATETYFCGALIKGAPQIGNLPIMLFLVVLLALVFMYLLSELFVF